MTGIGFLARYKAAIFDLDGTLMDSEPAWEKAKRIVADRYGLRPTQAQLDATVGRSLDDFLAEVFGTRNHDEMLARREEIFVEADRLLPGMRVPVPGAADFLRAVAAAGLRVAICSSSARRHIEGAVRELGVTAEVSLIVSAAELARGKPDPMPYRVSVERLGL
ncbi:HAD family hydrolase [Paracoccus pacificus]|uniref:HAD family hydrolase n=1 Tax=Paracoccus pacificus TaxID=1463598 RepID=A0ABW4R671_9RHOB